MARQFPVAGNIESLRNHSWRLCRLLDSIIGTKEEVALHRKCDTMRFFVMGFDMSHTRFDTSHTLLFSGSQGEGFNFKTSDFDLMFIDRNTVVLESEHSSLSTDASKTVLIMRKEGCKPGFVILQLLNRTTSHNIGESIVEYRDHPVVSSLLYRDTNKIPDIGQTAHGPCNTFHYIVEVDMAYCFECHQWPTEAIEFIYRQRRYGWPPKSLLDKIVCRGCHLVPIGDKDPDLSHIQWRLSFSAAEKDLVHSFNHTMFLVYGLLKIFLKEFIDKFQSLHGILCSYFVKTAMFYCIENTPHFLWREDLLITCFWICLNKLIAWVKQGYCPNYFVPQNNMFRNKVFGNNRHKLLLVLNKCKCLGWTCLSLCESLRAVRNIDFYSNSGINCKLILSDGVRELLLDYTVASMTLLSCIDYGEKHIPAVCSLTLLNHSRTQQEQDFSRLLLCNSLRCIGRSNVSSGEDTNNKYRYKLLRKRQYALTISSRNLGHVGMLDLAQYFYQIGQYRKSVHIISRMISMWKSYVLYYSTIHRTFYNGDLYQRYVCGQGIRWNDKLKFAFVKDVHLHKDVFYPEELCHDVDATAPFPLVLPPLPYTVFLLFLCHQRLGNVDRCVSAFHDLEVLTHDSTQGCRQHPVVLNMLAICLYKLGNRLGAVEMCLKSQKKKRDKNGADKLLDQILSRMC